MSDPEQRHLDSIKNRYEAGLPPRDQGERENQEWGERENQEWGQLDAEDRASAIEERFRPDQEYEGYEGSLDWWSWLEERRGSDELGHHQPHTGPGLEDRPEELQPGQEPHPNDEREQGAADPGRETPEPDAGLDLF